MTPLWGYLRMTIVLTVLFFMGWAGTLDRTIAIPGIAFFLLFIWFHYQSRDAAKVLDKSESEKRAALKDVMNKCYWVMMIGTVLGMTIFLITQQVLFVMALCIINFAMLFRLQVAFIPDKVDDAT